MATAFNIFQDKENNCNQTKKFDKNTRENENVNRAKLTAITNVQQNDENATEKQVRNVGILAGSHYIY